MKIENISTHIVFGFSQKGFGFGQLQIQGTHCYNECMSLPKISDLLHAYVDHLVENMTLDDEPSASTIWERPEKDKYKYRLINGIAGIEELSKDTIIEGVWVSPNFFEYISRAGLKILIPEAELELIKSPR